MRAMELLPTFLEGLNDAQREAVTAPPGPLLVLAGAGSGKTRVLTQRIAWLIQVEGLSPHSILAVTFTNKAANEMRARIESLLQIPARGMWVGTFHGLAHRLLRTHWRDAHLPEGFQILDAEDQLRLVKRVMRELDLDESRWPPKQAVWYINARKDEGVRPQHMQDTGDVTARQLIRVYTAYEAACTRAGVVDFAELLLRSLELLRDNAALLEHYRSRFRHLLVDEFQDTNTLQYAWLRLLAGEHTPVFAVGDDDQSIYGWRGARIENIQFFTRDFPQAITLRLEQNYRSTGTILQAANGLIEHNAGRLGKQLWTAGNQGDPIDLYTAYNEIDEADFVAARIEEWVDSGRRRDEVAILYRSNAQSRVFESTFNQRNIPYRVYGGQRFFERAEIKDALAYLRLAMNPDDDTSLERVINQPPRGIGDRTVALVRERAREKQQSLWQAIHELLEHDGLPTRTENALRGLVQIIGDLGSVRGEAVTLAEQVDQVIEVSTLRAHFQKEKGEKAQARVENLDELVSAAQGFRPDEMETEMEPLAGFLAHASLEAGEGQGAAWDDCVQMMTLHSAKGLEFPLVFICGLEEGLFPHMSAVEETGRLEEERRLCYVGVTRAREKLVLSWAEVRRLHGRENYNLASKFIGEIPDELLRDIRPRVTVRPYPSTPAAARPATGMQRGATNETGFQLGQRVRHPKFGEGVVLGYEGAGRHARVQVGFTEAGDKWLVLEYANLQTL
jgi:DNA helicase-2/ATP-dependent DNA helicase PcrA